MLAVAGPARRMDPPRASSRRGEPAKATPLSDGLSGLAAEELKRSRPSRGAASQAARHRTWATDR